jgi:hypothetical protein
VIQGGSPRRITQATMDSRGVVRGWKVILAGHCVMAKRRQRGALEKRPIEGKPSGEAQNLKAKGREAFKAGARVCITALKILAKFAAAMADLGAYLVLKAAHVVVWILAQTWRLFLWPIRTLPLWLNIGGVVLSVVAAIIALYEFFDEAVPYIEPDQVTSTSWHDLPFNLKIDSRLFGASDIQVRCFANEIGWVVSAATKGFSSEPLVAVDQIEHVIPPHGTISFTCNMAEANSKTPSSDQVNPVNRIELQLQVRYRSFLWPWGDTVIVVPWQREVTSTRFTWREVSPGTFQWLEGEAHGP